MKMGNDLQVSESEICVYGIIPERMLFLNVLERALNDLSVPDRHTRTTAYNWFNEDITGLPKWVSFRDIKEHIILDRKKNVFIRKALKTYETNFLVE